LKDSAGIEAYEAAAEAPDPPQTLCPYTPSPDDEDLEQDAPDEETPTGDDLE
jgi:hypothetical protein